MATKTKKKKHSTPDVDHRPTRPELERLALKAGAQAKTYGTLYARAVADARAERETLREIIDRRDAEIRRLRRHLAATATLAVALGLTLAAALAVGYSLAI